MPVKKGGKRKVIARHPVASVVKDGKVAQKVKPIRKFSEEPANVRISMGVTLNMGNYESLRIGVDLSVPCPNTKTGIESACKSATAYVEKKLSALHKKHKGAEPVDTDDVALL